MLQNGSWKIAIHDGVFGVRLFKLTLHASTVNLGRKLKIYIIVIKVTAWLFWTKSEKNNEKKNSVDIAYCHPIKF